MAKNLFNRYVWLVDLICRNRRITLKEINERRLNTDFSEGRPIPLRTFHNHREAIQDLFDINIVCDKRTHEYYIEDADGLNGGGVRNWLLNAFAVDHMLNESHRLKKRIMLENIPSGQQYLTTVVEAMRDNRLIRFSYQRYDADTSNVVEAEPWFLKTFRQRWYLVGKNQRQQLRIYALDRIQSLQISHTPFLFPSDLDVELFFNDCFGIFCDETLHPEKIILRVSRYQSNYLRALPLHPSQRESSGNEHHSVFTYTLKPSYDFIQEILSLGDTVEVIAPGHLRKKINDLIAAMATLYLNPQAT